MAQRAKIGEQIKDAVTRDLVNACATLGYKASVDAYKKHTYNHRTHALHDSYGSAVYLDGKLVPETIRYTNRGRQRTDDSRGWRGAKDQAANPKDWRTGRQALHHFLENPPRMSTKNHITILVVAAQWYASMLEEGTEKRKKYTVLDFKDVKSSISQNFNEVIGPVLKKYGLSDFLPTLKRGLGVDETWKDISRSR